MILLRVSSTLCNICRRRRTCFSVNGQNPNLASETQASSRKSCDWSATQRLKPKFSGQKPEGTCRNENDSSKNPKSEKLKLKMKVNIKAWELKWQLLSVRELTVFILFLKAYRVKLYVYIRNFAAFPELFFLALF